MFGKIQRVYPWGLVFLGLFLGVLFSGCHEDHSTGPEDGDSSSSSSSTKSSSSVKESSSSVKKSSSLSSSSEEKNSSSSSALSSSDEGYSSEESSSSSRMVSSSSLNARTCSYSEKEATLKCSEQTYKTVVIGSQTWMAENLNYSLDSSWCYNQDADSCEKYGRLYQWYAAMASCPAGWHLPNDDEWQTLYDYVDAHNGDEGVGTSLKSVSGWDYDKSSQANTDLFGFSALPGGYRNTSKDFSNAGQGTNFWSATEGGDDYAFRWFMIHGYGRFGHIDSYHKNGGFSVRCLKAD